MGKIKYLLIAAGLAVCLWAYYYYNKAMDFVDTFTYGYKITRINSSILSGLASLGNGTANVDFDFTAWIQNNTTFAITLTNLELKFYHAGKYIGYSNHISPIVIAANGKSTFTGSGLFVLNKALFETALAITNKIVRIDYTARFKVFGLPFYLSYKYHRNVNVLDYI